MGSGNRFELRWVGSGLVPFFSSKGYNFLFVKIGAVCILLRFNRKKLVPKTVLSRVPSLTQWNSHIYLYLQKAETLSQFEYVHYYSNGDVLCVFFSGMKMVICMYDLCTWCECTGKSSGGTKIGWICFANIFKLYGILCVVRVESVISYCRETKG